MNRGTPGNMAASVRQRLLNIVAKTGDDANMVWTRFAVERLLYRLSVSDFSSEFILKGASLFTVWTKDAYRPTMDLDLLGVGVNSQERIFGIFRQLCGIPVDEDGLRFDPESVRIMEIRKSGDYHGERVNLLARLGNARIPLQVDIRPLLKPDESCYTGRRPQYWRPSMRYSDALEYDDVRFRRLTGIKKGTIYLLTQFQSET